MSDTKETLKLKIPSSIPLYNNKLNKLHIPIDCNHSSITLNISETLLLSFGLNFLLKPSDATDYEFLQEFSLFKRTISIRKEFELSDSPSNILHIHNPTYQPPHPGSHIANYLTKSYQLLIKYLHKYPAKIHKKSRFQNSINSLKSKTNIIIRPTDKNLGPIVLDKSTYLYKCNKYLTDNNNSYLPISNDLIPSNLNVYVRLANILHKYNYLYNSEN